jgi:predicted HTH domain antitoxin
MSQILELPPEEEALFRAWASRQKRDIKREAEQLYAASSDRNAWNTLMTLFLKAVSLTQPVLEETIRRNLGPGRYFLIILQTMTALSHANAGRPFTLAELSRRSPLEDAMTLYDLQIVSLGMAAQIAGISQSEFIDALGRAGISVFQYSAEDVLGEAAKAGAA